MHGCHHAPEKAVPVIGRFLHSVRLTVIRLGYLKHVAAGVIDEEESARKLAKIAGSKDAELDEVLADLFGSSEYVPNK